LRFDAILFDFDGVLADTERVHHACWNRILEPFGIQVEWPVYLRECVGVSDRLMIQRLASERIPPIAFEDVWAQYPRKLEMFHQYLTATPPFLSDTLDLVRELGAEYALAVVSSSARPEVEPPLEQAGILACFRALVCGREVPELKPSPVPYLRAAELLGARRPLVVEDSDAGEVSGRAAGFEVVRVSSAEAVAREVRAALRVR
jgi:HAD superfamily hydrolase (TIGR01509 family)